MAAPQHTVAIAFVRSAVAALDAAQRERALRDAGIAAELLGRPQARVPALAFGTLWMAVARELDDEFFGLDARRMKAGSFALLCHALAGQGQVGRAMRLAARGFGLFLDDVTVRLAVDGGTARLELDNRISPQRGQGDARRFADEAMLVMLVGLLCWLAGRRVPLRQLQMAHPRPAHADEYRRMFAPQVAFDAPLTAMSFDAAALDAPLAVSPASLKAFLRDAPQSVFLKQVAASGWAERVRRRLRRAAGPWPTIEAMADEFAVSPATLHRRLAAEGTGWQALKDELRRDLAIHHLAAAELSVMDIAGRLGFDDASSFSRAFRKWTGSAPGAYRRQG